MLLRSQFTHRLLHFYVPNSPSTRASSACLKSTSWRSSCYTSLTLTSASTKATSFNVSPTSIRTPVTRSNEADRAFIRDQTLSPSCRNTASSLPFRHLPSALSRPRLLSRQLWPYTKRLSTWSGERSEPFRTGVSRILTPGWTDLRPAPPLNRSPQPSSRLLPDLQRCLLGWLMPSLPFRSKCNDSISMATRCKQPRSRPATFILRS